VAAALAAPVLGDVALVFAMSNAYHALRCGGRRLAPVHPPR
jgi:hypothetical protein